MPFDHDLDIAIIGKEDVSKFYLLQNFQQYHHLIENRLYDIQLNVYSVYRDYDSHNSVDGRIIDKSNGLYIDIFLYLKYGDNYVHKCYKKINENILMPLKKARLYNDSKYSIYIPNNPKEMMGLDYPKFWKQRRNCCFQT